MLRRCTSQCHKSVITTRSKAKLTSRKMRFLRFRPAVVDCRVSRVLILKVHLTEV